ncbi:hypothetical protein [Spirosoma montaniterrae]|uniref:Glycosyltransferase RgtA/B/C/D-like domain-containing protein n=1 Tax=Spirosoma montaniterrae TaxID=1178516 RepID=A0A1P9WRX6_9BACT|nr:hypothetical protein [Spirosoma montaniterrae]AQG78114.1 hypothetical protein AWR27_01345 [Spirosoma montaniterrae]
MRPYRSIAAVVLLAVYVVVFFLRDKLAYAIAGDEVHFWPTVLMFAKEPIPSVHLLNNYPEVIAPLPFMMGGWLVNLFGESIQPLRVLNFLLSFGLLMVFLTLSSGPRRFWIAALGLIAFPYYYFCSTIYYTDMIALTFILLGWVGYLKGVHWAACLAFVAAICSRQYAIVFPATIIAYELAPAVMRWPVQIASTWRQVLAKPYLLYYVLAGVTLLAWVLFWGGLGPAPEVARQKYNDTVHEFMYKPGFVLYASACLGVYYVLPEMILARTNTLLALRPVRPLWLAAGVGLVAVLVIFFPAIQMNDGFFVVPVMGMLDQVLIFFGIVGTVKQIVLGGLMLLTWLRFASPASGLAGWVVLLNLILMGKAHIAWDKYLLPTIGTLWLLTLWDKHWPFSRIAAEQPRSVTIQEA